VVKAIINEFTENTYIINEKQDCYIVDPGAHSQEIIDYIEEKQYNVLGILLTHGHFDHIYSLDDVQSHFDCDVYVHELARDFLFDPNLNLSSTIRRPITFKRKRYIQLLRDKLTLPLGRETITVYHTPGHTRGCVSYHYKRFLLSGDFLFKGTIGRTDLPTSSRTSMTRSIEYILKHMKDNTVVYPGHGHFTTILTEKMENPFVKEIL
jgi:glyoxylase-like metal-dependent hydrolase (beta-lactamase superfamily II)